MPKAFWYAAIVAALSFAALCLRATWMLNDVAPQLQAEVTDLNRVTLSVGGTAAELRGAAKDWRAASASSQAMSQQALKVLANSADATHALNQMVQHTDDSLNVVLIPSLARTIDENNARVAQLARDTDATVLAMAKTSAEATAAMAEATETLATAGKVLGDPAIPKIMASTETTAANIADATRHVDETTGLIEAKVREMVKPASMAKRVGITLLNLASDLKTLF
jgi:hypothetical protein